MAAINEITGDAIQTRMSSEAYRNNYDLIFGKNKPTKGSIKDVNSQENRDLNVSCNCDVTVELTPRKPL